MKAMLFRATKSRKFEYIPSFYDEKNDKEPDRRISFRRDKFSMRKKKSFLGLIILMIIAILLLINLNKMRHEVPQNIELDNMEVVK